MKDLLPTHTDAERTALKDDIKANGLQVPVVIDEHGEIIDGRLRAEIADELKLSWKKGADVRFGLSEAEKQALRIRLNLLRRSTPPTEKQRREHRRILLMAHPEMSDQVIAEMCGASRSAVQRDRNQLAKTGKFPKAVATVGKDGKRRKVNPKPRVIVSSEAELKKVAEDWKTIGELEGEAPTGLTTLKRLARSANTARRKSRREGTPVELLPENVKLHHCDFRALAIEPGSVDLVLTDIPYGNEFVPDLADLAIVAQNALKDGGLFVTYVGQLYLPTYFEHFCRYLDYRWQLASVWNADANVVHALNAVSKWKPVLVFSKGDWLTRGNWPDVLQIESKEKMDHPWQQPLAEVERLVRYFSRPGDLVVDACMGTGTTALACMTADGGPRRFIGCDRDQDMFNSAQMRIDEHLRLVKEAA